MKRDNKAIRNDKAAYLFIAPFVLLSIVFMLFPICRGFYNSFFDFNWGHKFVGFKNFITVFESPIYLKSIVNTLLIVLFTVPSMIVFGIIISGSVFDKKRIHVSFVRVCLYIPVIASMVVMVVIWRFLLDSQTGLCRYFFDLLGKKPINLLGDEFWAFALVVFILISSNIGQVVVLYIAAMIGIPKELIESLAIDGGNRYHLFRYILIPFSKATTLFVFITQTSAMLRAFVVIQLLTNGGPNYRTTTMMFQLYQDGINNGNFGLASALGVIMFLMTLLLVLLQYKNIKLDGPNENIQ